jgi:hypothetical protein
MKDEQIFSKTSGSLQFLRITVIVAVSNSFSMIPENHLSYSRGSSRPMYSHVVPQLANSVCRNPCRRTAQPLWKLSIISGEENVSACAFIRLLFSRKPKRCKLLLLQLIVKAVEKTPSISGPIQDKRRGSSSRQEAMSQHRR